MAAKVPEPGNQRGDYRFGVSVRVRWQECDAQGIAFNGSYLGWLEGGTG